MFKLQQHLRNNKGDANVSKMTIIAIAFVVGAVLLVLTTSAFKNPINRWFSNVTSQWFDSANGEFDLMLNPFANYERLENGTYKDVKYICRHSDGGYDVLLHTEDMQNGTIGVYYTDYYNASGRWDGEWDWMPGYGAPPMQLVISDDGTTITIDGQVFTAEVP